MPTRNALAAARLRYAQAAPTAPYRVTLQVWSHSFDHPDPIRRSALVTSVFLTQLPPGTGYVVSNVAITDRYGVDQSGMWTRSSGANEEGFAGYTEYDTAGVCGHGLPSVFWGPSQASMMSAASTTLVWMHSGSRPIASQPRRSACSTISWAR
jgi:hypothetical protein